MVSPEQAVEEIRAFGLSADLRGTRLAGATSKNGNLYQGSAFAIEHKGDEWEARLIGHLFSWGRVNRFRTLDDAVNFVKKVYSELPDFLADGWKPNAATYSILYTNPHTPPRPGL